MDKNFIVDNYCFEAFIPTGRRLNLKFFVCHTSEKQGGVGVLLLTSLPPVVHSSNLKVCRPLLRRTRTAGPPRVVCPAPQDAVRAAFGRSESASVPALYHRFARPPAQAGSARRPNRNSIPARA